MAYMRHERLVRLLKTGWKATCNYKQVLRKKSFKVVSRLEADNKTVGRRCPRFRLLYRRRRRRVPRPPQDAEELEEARRKRDEVDHNCALANLKLYKMVALSPASRPLVRRDRRRPPRPPPLPQVALNNLMDEDPPQTLEQLEPAAN